MRRLGSRALMVAIGRSMLACYPIASYLAFRVLVGRWLDRGRPLASAAIVVQFALLVGLSSDLFGTARLLASL